MPVLVFSEARPGFLVSSRTDPIYSSVYGMGGYRDCYTLPE